VIEFVKIGSCLGRNFDSRLVAKVIDIMPVGNGQRDGTHTTDVVSLMDIAITEGIVIPMRLSGRFLFAHDRIQQAAYSLFLPDVEKRNASHLCIGRILKTQLESAGGDQHSEWLALAAAEQLNLGVEQITNQGERTKLAHLNCKAAELAGEKSAFFPSKTYLEAGLALLDDGRKWNQNYDLTLKMTTMLARMQYATGSTNECKKSVSEVLRHARTMREKTAVYIIEIEALGSEGHATEAINLALDVLKQLGEPFPRKPGRLDIMGDISKVQKLMKGRTSEELLSAPEVTDENKRDAMDILRLLSVFAIVSAQRNFLDLLQVRQIRLALMHGVSKCTPMALASWGYFQANTGNWEEGARLGILSLKYLDRFESDIEIHAEALKLNHVYLYHLKHTIRDSLDPMFQAYQLGMQTGGRL
jgi:predicted ATPase